MSKNRSLWGVWGGRGEVEVVQVEVVQVECGPGGLWWRCGGPGGNHWKNSNHTSRDLLRLCVRWVGDVCVRKVGRG